MNNPDIEKIIRNKIIQTQRWIEHDLPVVVGNTAVKHFKDNFNQEGFVDNGVHKWPDVKRRDSTSKWYGFNYKGEKRTSVAFSRSKKTGKTYRSKKQKKLNFSSAATRWKILHNSGELKDSIIAQPYFRGVRISSDKAYAEVQNNGGTIRVFGKGSAHIPARPFIGDSKELKEKIDKIVDDGLEKIFKD